MGDRRARTATGRAARKPIGRARLEELALAYVARFATSSGRLEAYLLRKLRESGWDDADEGDPDVPGLVARFVARGWIDDAAWGRMRAQGLLTRGYGQNRIDSVLRGDGIEEDVRRAVAPGEFERREAAVAQARRRRLGPFGGPPAGDPAAQAKARQKQLAAMLRAGHDFAAANRVVRAATCEELEAWVEEARDEDVAG